MTEQQDSSEPTDALFDALNEQFELDEEDFFLGFDDEVETVSEARQEVIKEIERQVQKHLDDFVDRIDSIASGYDLDGELVKKYFVAALNAARDSL